MAKPQQILAAMDCHPDRVIVWLDVDCVVYGDLSPLAETRADVAFRMHSKYRRWHKGTRFRAQSGTMVFRPTPAPPSWAFIFADETMYTMDDAFMQMADDSAPAFPNAPSYYHCGGATFSFADGHAEAHSWKGPVLKSLPYAVGKTSGGGDNNTTSSDPDWIWLYPKMGCESNAHRAPLLFQDPRPSTARRMPPRCPQGRALGRYFPGSRKDPIAL